MARRIAHSFADEVIRYLTGGARGISLSSIAFTSTAGARTRAEAESLHQATRLPLLLGSTPPELADREFLAAQGVRIAPRK